MPWSWIIIIFPIQICHCCVYPTSEKASLFGEDHSSELLLAKLGKTILMLLDILYFSIKCVLVVVAVGGGGGRGGGGGGGGGGGEISIILLLPHLQCFHPGIFTTSKIQCFAAIFS